MTDVHELGLGTQLRHVLELMDGAVAQTCVDLGLTDYRPRFSPVLRALVEHGPSSIGRLAELVNVTHSAASQTVAQLRQRGYVTLEPGADARTRIVTLTGKARTALPTIQAEWAVSRAAAIALDAELPHPLGELVAAIGEALGRRPFRARIADAARASTDPAVRQNLAAFTGTR